VAITRYFISAVLGYTLTHMGWAESIRWQCPTRAAPTRILSTLLGVVKFYLAGYDDGSDMAYDAARWDAMEAGERADDDG
jgi:hypothetical protein